jgi:hypothetical protein
MTREEDLGWGRGLREDENAGNDQINVLVLKTLLVNKTRLYVVF